MSVKAVAKGVRISPRKVSVVAALVRNRSVSDAMAILEHTPRGAAEAVLSVVKSAKANAEYNHGYKADGLRIAEINVVPGPSLTRFRPAAHGRALPYKHRSCHITVVVDGEKREVKKPVVKAAADKTPKTTKKETK